jgi:TonB family protein
MTTSIVLYLLATSAVASLAALAADEGLRRAALPSRWLWLATMAAPPALLLAPLLTSRFGLTMASGLPMGPVVELPAVVAGPDAGGDTLAVVAAGLWLATSLAMGAVLVHGHRALSRERGRWERSNVLGRSVYVSRDRGPAIAGVWRPWIVLPRWSLALPSPELVLVLVHEEEHARAGDAALLTAALALVVLAPWNPLTWWQLRRLRMAMEVDCDRRVLRREPDPERYGRSLLSVASRARGPSLGLASFTERSLSLERRILVMTSKRSRWTPMWACTLVVLSLLIGAQACGVESPVVSDAPSDAQTAELPATASSFGDVEEVRFTPFTVAPSILNREEVVRAMNSDYPPLLREAGIGGTVKVYFFIDDGGSVRDTRIQESSGHPAIDAAALAVASVYRFSPALNGDERVPVWVSFPITFQAQ